MWELGEKECMQVVLTVLERWLELSLKGSDGEKGHWAWIWERENF